MKGSNNEIQLRIGFPRSSEDHRLQLVEVNGSIFAIVHSLLESNGPIKLHCEEWSLILLAPIKSKTDIVISAINVVCLNTVESEEGVVSINASNQLVSFVPPAKSSIVSETGERGKFQFHDDPVALLNHSKLFNKVVSFACGENLESSVVEAQKAFMMSLCAMAQKMDMKTENLNLQRVLGIWDIPWL